MKCKLLFVVVFSFLIVSCKDKSQVTTDESIENYQQDDQKSEELKSPNEDLVNLNDIVLNLSQANRLASLPLNCITKEYPNKTGQVLSDSTDLGTPKELHPAFYGCFDWHSSVHGHWTLVKLIKSFPELDHRDSILMMIENNLNKANIREEIKYFQREQEYSYERMYGWAWLLKLQMELDTWDDEKGKALAENLQPLSDLIIDRYIEFLPKLKYPIRVGTHTNSAFGMSFAYDYAKHAKNDSLILVIEDTANRLYLRDKKCPIGWEPSGYDFLSPCLAEVELMNKILPRDAFSYWINDFMPDLKSNRFSMQVAEVSDREDGHLVHLDGLNFSRAWVFYHLANSNPNEYGHLKKEGDKHLAHSLSAIVDGSYEGEHWLASFALYALSQR